MTAREEIKNLIEKAVKNLYGKEVEVKIEKPAEMTYGDYATNVAMTLKKNKIELDRKILANLAQNHPEIFEKIVEISLSQFLVK